MSKSNDPFNPPVALLCRLGSIAVHADEYTGPGSHDFDRQAIRSLLDDAEVKAWLQAMDKLALLPKKRQS